MCVTALKTDAKKNGKIIHTNSGNGIPENTEAIPEINPNKIVNELKKDKKVVGGKVEFVLLEKIGKAKYGVNVSNKIIKEAIEENK